MLTNFETAKKSMEKIGYECAFYYPASRPAQIEAKKSGIARYLYCEKKDADIEIELFYGYYFLTMLRDSWNTNEFRPILKKYNIHPSHLTREVSKMEKILSRELATHKRREPKNERT